MSYNFSKNKKLVAAAKEIARQLRVHQTPAEDIFWKAVRDKQFLGLKFYRQHPLFFEFVGKESFFIADFYCHERQLVVEIDGPIHKFQKEYDWLREHIINALEVRVLRFTNEEVENNLKSVLQNVEAFLSL
ncbi:MAG: endonuclease domain-containing protein [Bacteroidetes bacterium]|nr:MAG: endonuclease domain-containing protein [Bacteroidota bacterium]